MCGSRSRETSVRDRRGFEIMPDQPDHILAASRFWNLLGKPKGFTGWDAKIKPLLEESGMALDEFRLFLDWAVNTNEYSVEYLRKAKDPMASLTKNMPTLLKFYKIYETVRAVKSKSAKSEGKSSRKAPSQLTREYNKEKIW